MCFQRKQEFNRALPPKMPFVLLEKRGEEPTLLFLAGGVRSRGRRPLGRSRVFQAEGERLSRRPKLKFGVFKNIITDYSF